MNITPAEWPGPLGDYRKIEEQLKSVPCVFFETADVPALKKGMAKIGRYEVMAGTQSASNDVGESMDTIQGAFVRPSTKKPRVVNRTAPKKKAETSNPQEQIRRFHKLEGKLETAQERLKEETKKA